MRNLGLTLRPAEQLGGAEASQCAGRVGFSPPRPLPAGGGSRRHWRLSGVQTCASLSRAWFTCSPLELFKNNHVHTNFPWETAQEAPPRGRGGGGSVWADPGRGRQLGRGQPPQVPGPTWCQTWGLVLSPARATLGPCRGPGNVSSVAHLKSLSSPRVSLSPSPPPPPPGDM